MGEFSWVWKVSTALLSVAVVILFVVLFNMESLNRDEKRKETLRTIDNFTETLQRYFNKKEQLQPEYGLFVDTPIISRDAPGRKIGGLEDTAVILEFSNTDDTMRWLDEIIKARTTNAELPVYIYKGSEAIANETDALRREIRKKRQFYKGVDVHLKTNHTSLVNSIAKLNNIEFLIEISDTDFMGYDWADFYYLGGQVMRLDEKINCVCGGEKYEKGMDAFFEPTRGDLLWLTDNECAKGPMTTSASIIAGKEKDLQTCLRPEVSRISDNEQRLTKMSWHLAQMDPKLLTVEQFQKRLQHDYSRANHMQKIQWNSLIDKEQVYTFPYSDDDDLKHYFDEDLVETIMDTKTIAGQPSTLMLHKEGYKLYIYAVSEEEKPSTRESPDDLKNYSWD